MHTATSPVTPRLGSTDLLGLAAISSLAYVLADILHEFGHTAIALLLGIKVVTFSTVGMQTPIASASAGLAGVALAGPMVNFVLGLALLLALVRQLSPAWRYFAWLLGTINLFNATIYLVSSSISNSGDWAKVFAVVAPPALWRPIAGPIGFVLYIAIIFASLAVLSKLCKSGVLSSSNVLRYCAISYFTGSVVLTIASVFNPLGVSYILPSGVGAGFGATAGLWALPPLLDRRGPNSSFVAEKLYVGWRWIGVSIIATVVFIGVFGPGLRFGK